MESEFQLWATFFILLCAHKFWHIDIHDLGIKIWSEFTGSFELSCLHLVYIIFYYVYIMFEFNQQAQSKKRKGFLSGKKFKIHPV